MKLKGEIRMSYDLNVGAVGTSDAALSYEPKEDYEKRQTQLQQEALTSGLTGKGSKSARKARAAELASRYSGFSKITALYDFDKDGLTDKVDRKQISAKDAKRAAKNQVANEAAFEKVRKTVVYFDKAEYDANKKADKKAGLEPQYIKNKDVRNYIENNRHLFFDENGNFSQDMYKDEVVKWTGADWRLNLDERRALAYEGQSDHLSKHAAKKMAEYGGFEIQKDYTLVKRVGVIAGSLAAAVGMAYAFPKVTNVDAESIVNVLHQNGVTDFEVSKLYDSIKKKQVNPTAALMAALPPAILAASLIKEKTDKDVFTETEAARIVNEENGAKRVLDEHGNREIVQAIKDLPHLNNDQKIMAIMYAYGESTGKKVNERELIAAYEAAKAADDWIAQHGQIQPTLHPTEPTVPTVPTQPTVPTAPTQPTVPTVPTVPTQPTVPTVPTQPTAPTQPTVPPVEPTPEPAMVIVQNGESIARLAKKYGVSEKDIIELNKDQLKYFKSATNCDDNKKYLGFLVGAKIKLPAGANEEAIEENRKTTSEIEEGRYRKSAKKLDTKLCDERTKTYKPLDEGFRKKEKIRTVGEYEAELEAQAKAKAPSPEHPTVRTEKVPMSEEEFHKRNPFIARPADDTSAYEAPKWEAPKPFIPTAPEVKSKEPVKTAAETKSAPVEQRMPSIQEMYDEAQARKAANEKSAFAKGWNWFLTGKYE